MFNENCVKVRWVFFSCRLYARFCKWGPTCSSATLFWTIGCQECNNAFLTRKAQEIKDTSRYNHMRHRCTHSPQTNTGFVLLWHVKPFFYCTDSWKYNNELIVPIVFFVAFFICKIKLTWFKKIDETSCSRNLLFTELTPSSSNASLKTENQ